MKSRTPFFASSEAHEPNMVQGEALLEGGACSLSEAVGRICEAKPAP